MDLVTEKRNLESEGDDCLGNREIGNPAGNEHCTAQLEVPVEQSVHCNEDRELKQHRETSSERAHAFLLVEGCSLLVQLLRIVLVPGLEFLHLGLQCAHLGSGGCSFS